MSTHKQFLLLTRPEVQASDRKASQDINKLRVFGCSKTARKPPAADVGESRGRGARLKWLDLDWISPFIDPRSENEYKCT